MMRVFLCFISATFLFLNASFLKAGVPTAGGNLQVVGEARNKLIPIALLGYSGEVAAVLKFDLEVMGCTVVPELEASFILKGAVDGAVRGALSDKAGNFGFNRRYAGGSVRDQAHALSNDTIQALVGKPGIAHTRILFKMKTGQRAEEIFLSDFDGHKPVALTNDKTLVGSPKWSPDSTQLVYERQKKDIFQLYKYNLLTRRHVQLTFGRHDSEKPAWAPNRKQIIFSAKMKKVPKLYYISSFGGRTIRVTKSPQNISETNPVWSK